MFRFKYVLLPGLALAVLGCAPKSSLTLTGDTAYEMQSSIIRVSEGLSAARKDEFDQAIETIILSATDRRLAYDGYRLSPEAMRLLRGRSVTQVIESAKLIRSVARAY